MTHATPHWTVDNHFAQLGADFSSPVQPTPLKNPKLIHANAELGARLGLSKADLHSDQWRAILAGNAPLPGGAPVAAIYGGHQFGHWAGQLGDGRAILLGQLRAPDGQSWDLQLKGAGMTPYSRFADGRAVIRSSVREYLAGEALHHLGIPTTRALSLITADDEIHRETFERAAVICRVAPSHVRFGNFEWFYSQNQPAQLRALADYVIRHFYPELIDAPDRYHDWLRQVSARSARLIAHWQAVGFCHGVMNTDNMSILGLTLDYGPYGFMDAFDAAHICNHSDHNGRYAWHQQPGIGHWNCARLVQACSALLSDEPPQQVQRAQAILDHYAEVYSTTMRTLWLAKFGLRGDGAEDDAATEVMNGFLALMQQNHADFTLSFRALAQVSRAENSPAPRALSDHFFDTAALTAWLQSYQARLRAEGQDDAARAQTMNRINPRIVLRNYLAQQVIEDVEAGNSAALTRLLDALSTPYSDDPGLDAFAQIPPPEAARISVSCSS